MENYINPAQVTYVLDKLPLTSLRWGEGRLRKTLYMSNDMERPIVVWLVGVVASKWFHFGMNNDPVAKASINIAPLCDEKLDAWQTVLRKLSEPVKAKGESVSAKRRRTHRATRRGAVI